MEFLEKKEIENANVIIEHFGYWPTFHDSEIISLTLERTTDGQSSKGLLKVYAFEMTNKIIGRHYKLVKHCLVNIEISDLVKTEIEGFNHQNAILALEFGREKDNLYCNIVGTYGIEGYLEGKRIIIKSLEPTGEH